MLYKCRRFPPDLIITLDDAAFDFALRNREELGVEIPIVFGGLNRFSPDMIAGQEKITGISDQSDFSGTIQLIESLCPQAKHILLLSNQRESGQASIRHFQTLMPQYTNRYDFTVFDDWTNEELFKRVEALNDDWAAIILDVTSDKNGTINYNDPNFNKEINSRTGAPIFLTALPPGDFDSTEYPWNGVGGGMVVATDHGIAVGKLAHRVLEGENPDDIPVVRYSPQQLKVDYRQLQYYGMDEKQLPAGTDIINKPFNFYQIHQSSIIAAGMAFLFLTGTILVLSFNIMRRKRAEQALLSTQEQLRSAQKMEAIGLLAGGIAHDFNNILQIIGGHASLIEEDLQQKPELVEDVQVIQRATERATQLTRQLLAFSRKQRLQAEPFDPNVMVEDMAKMLRRVLGTHIDLKVRPYYVEPITVVADRGQLEQVLLNLCINARDAMPSGGRIDIRIGYRSFKDTDTDKPPELKAGDYMELSVRDNGSGMPGTVIERLFEPFFTTKAVGKGTGMGLAVAYGIIKQHEGTIAVYSEEGEGSEFVILLPIDRKELPKREVQAIKDIPDGTGTILFAEDDEAVRRIGIQLLHRAGYHVLEAENGAEAITLIQLHHKEIKLALLDVIMPKCNGRQVFDYLQEKYPHIPVIFSTGYSADMLPPELAPEVGIALLNKPYSGQELLSLVHQMLKDENRAAPPETLS